MDIEDWVGGGAWGGEKRKPKAASELAEIKELPNPFVFADGSSVRNANDWQRRRAELKGMFADYEYGHMPPKPQKMTIERGAVTNDEASKLSIQDLTLNLEQDGKTLALHLRLYLPSEAKGKLPVVIQSSFGPRMKTPIGKFYAIFASEVTRSRSAHSWKPRPTARTPAKAACILCLAIRSTAAG